VREPRVLNTHRGHCGYPASDGALTLWGVCCLPPGYGEAIALATALASRISSTGRTPPLGVGPIGVAAGTRLVLVMIVVVVKIKTAARRRLG
jgi:hypothetical protein